MPRIYYGAIGRGLFQTVYPAGVEQPMIDFPLNAAWIALAVLLILIGIADWPLLAIGAAGLGLTAASAIFYAIRAPLERRRDNLRDAHDARGPGASRPDGAQLYAAAAQRGGRAFAPRDGGAR